MTLSIENGKLIITDGGRTVSTTDGTLVCLLPTVQQFNQSVVFPDFAKDDWYRWKFTESYDSRQPSFPHSIGNAAEFFITVIPQEYSAVQVLATAPAGADFFVGSVMLQRVSAPATTWQNEAIAVLVAQNQWIPWSGSALVEAMRGMARAISVYLDINPSSPTYRKLVIKKQQSVSVAPAGYGAFGDAGPKFHNSATGHTETFRSIAGTPVWTDGSAARNKTSQHNYADQPTFPNWDDCKRGNFNGCDTSDPTNFASTYLVSVQGRFGVRS